MSEFAPLARRHIYILRQCGHPGTGPRKYISQFCFNVNWLHVQSGDGYIKSDSNHNVRRIRDFESPCTFGVAQIANRSVYSATAISFRWVGTLALVIREKQLHSAVTKEYFRRTSGLIRYLVESLNTQCASHPLGFEVTWRENRIRYSTGVFVAHKPMHVAIWDMNFRLSEESRII